MNNCTCTPARYCAEDNLHYPPVLCDACIEQEKQLDAYMEEQSYIYNALEEWSGQPIKPLKGKPKHRTVNSIEDDLPF